MPPSARHKRIEIAHYRATVRAVVGRDLSALARRLEPKLAEVAGEDEAGACVDVGGSPWLLLPADASPGLVAHEALHAAVVVAVVAERAGLPVSAAADEVLCYMIEAIVDAARAAPSQRRAERVPPPCQRPPCPTPTAPPKRPR